MKGGDYGKIWVRKRCSVCTGVKSSWDFKVNGSTEVCSFYLMQRSWYLVLSWLTSAFLGAAVFAFTRFHSAIWLLCFLSWYFKYLILRKRIFPWETSSCPFSLSRQDKLDCVLLFWFRAVVEEGCFSAGSYLARLNIRLSLNNFHMWLNSIFIQHQCFIFSKLFSFLLWKGETFHPSLLCGMNTASMKDLTYLFPCEYYAK